VLALFFYGGEVLHGFAFTMLVGIVTGTYSTVFIAAAIAVLMSQYGAQGRRAQGPPASVTDARSKKTRVRAS
jgi:preprotein translocase subunit SecF